MTAMDCDRLAELAPELALEILNGDERAAAIAHVGHCVSCQELVSSLAGSVDRLLLLAPRATPPVGFEQRVLAAVSPQPTVQRTARRRTRRVVSAALAVAACVVLIAVALGVGGPERPAVAAAEMRTPAGDVVGNVVLGPDDPATMFVTLPGWAEQIASYAVPGGTYELRIERDDGPPQAMPITIDGDTTWAIDLDVSPDSITRVAVVDEQGDVWCYADL